MVLHSIDPVFDGGSKILILGSFPSVASREVGFFYGHPQNRFWRVLSALLGAEMPQTVEDKKALLISHGIALWDVIASCEIVGSADSTIKDAVANELSVILSSADIRAIFVNGKTAACFFSLFFKRSNLVLKLYKDIFDTVKVILSSLELTLRLLFSVTVF